MSLCIFLVWREPAGGRRSGAGVIAQPSDLSNPQPSLIHPCFCVPNSNRCLSTATANHRGSHFTSMSLNNTILHVGLDVAKLTLQLHLAGRFHSLTNDTKGHAQLLKLLRAHPHVQVVCEATGGYEQPVVRALHAADIPVSIIEAGRVRYFARAQGQRAKTDPIDAAVLPDYGAALQPGQWRAKGKAAASRADGRRRVRRSTWPR